MVSIGQYWRRQRALGRWLDSREARNLGRMLLVYSAVAVLAALGAGVLSASVEWVNGLVDMVLNSDGQPGPESSGFVAFQIPQGLHWLFFVVPTAGGLLAGLVIHFWAAEVAGGGVGLVIKSYHWRRGVLRRRVPFAKLLASIMTMGSGGSAGAEGPVAQISAGLASIVGGWLHLRPQRRRILTVTGMAAGIGAAFHAPLAGAIFASEVLYKEMEIEDQILVPAILTSTLAYCIYGLLFGWTPLLLIPTCTFEMVQILPYTVLAVILGASAWLFIQVLEASRRHIGRAQRIKPWLRPAVGGFSVGVLGMFVPSALGKGYALAQAAIDGHLGIMVLFGLAGAKLLATSLTVGSGGSGGKLSPSLVTGAAIGAGVGTATAHLLPGLGVSPAAFALVGMAGFFAAVANTPIGIVFLVSELTGSYLLLAPSMWVCAIAWFLTRKSSVFSAQVSRRLDAPPQLSEMMAAVLRRFRVRDALPKTLDPVVTVSPSTPAIRLLDTLASSVQSVFPIVSTQGHVLGVIDAHELRRNVDLEGAPTMALVAQDFMTPAISVTLEETLFDAFARMSGNGRTEDLVVIDDLESCRLVGLLSRRLLIKTYYQAMSSGESGSPHVPEPETATAEISLGSNPLAAALSRGGVIRGVKGTTPAEVLRALTQRAPLPPSLDPSGVCQALLAREALGSTAVGERVALPHPGPSSLDLPEEPIAILARLTTPVPWDAPDGQPVQLVGLILCRNQTSHLKLLGAMAAALSNREIRGALLGGAPKKRIIELVASAQHSSGKEGT